jgi:hypothetical protein
VKTQRYSLWCMAGPLFGSPGAVRVNQRWRAVPAPAPVPPSRPAERNARWRPEAGPTAPPAEWEHG